MFAFRRPRIAVLMAPVTLATLLATSIPALGDDIERDAAQGLAQFADELDQARYLVYGGAYSAATEYLERAETVLWNLEQRPDVAARTNTRALFRAVRAACENLRRHDRDSALDDIRLGAWQVEVAVAENTL
ncbi:MAG: hypothetical protein GC191_04615 [Azospirillum sp.]|nr:hypothetical protein [Azospirillum sp.]